MSKEGKEQQPTGMTRRGFLGRVSLGLAAAAALSMPIRNLLTGGPSATDPAEGLPEDSIYRPRDNSRGDGSLNA